MLRSTLSFLSLLVLTASLAHAQAENEPARMTPDELALMKQREADVKLLKEQIKDADMTRAADPANIGARIALLKTALQSSLGEEINHQAAGYLNIWSKDPAFQTAVLNNGDFITAIETNMMDHPMDHSTRVLSLVYGELIAARPDVLQRLKFTEKFISNRATQDRAILMLLSSWGSRGTADLSEYFTSKKIAAAFISLLKRPSPDSTKRRLASLLKGISQHNATSPLLGEPRFQALVTAAYQQELNATPKRQEITNATPGPQEDADSEVKKGGFLSAIGRRCERLLGLFAKKR